MVILGLWPELDIMSQSIRQEGMVQAVTALVALF